VFSCKSILFRVRTIYRAIGIAAAVVGSWQLVVGSWIDQKETAAVCFDLHDNECKQTSNKVRGNCRLNLVYYNAT